MQNKMEQHLTVFYLRYITVLVVVVVVVVVVDEVVCLK